MVCCTVLITVIVIHTGYKKTPMPACIELLFLDILGRILCMKPKTKKTTYLQNKSSEIRNGDVYHVYDNATMTVSTDVLSERKEMEGEITGFDHAQLDTLVSCANSLSKITYFMDKFRLGIEDTVSSEEVEQKWKLLACILDRCLLISYTLMAIFTTVFMIQKVVFESEDDYQELVQIWFGGTNSPDEHVPLPLL